MSILNLIRTELRNIPPYIPGGEEAQFRLHANELPWSPVMMDDINLNYYPDCSLHNTVHELMAARYGVSTKQITLTRGSDDGIDLISRLFLTAGQDALLQFPPTFPMYAFYVRLQQAELINCPLDKNRNFNPSLAAIHQSWRPNCKVIMFCSPNNPTGNLMDIDLIANVCERYANQSVVVVDEAYMEFSQAQSALSLLDRFENLLILKTMSKAAGLAGLRLGSIIAQPHIIDAFNRIIAPYSLSSAVISLAVQALNNPDWFHSATQTISTERKLLVDTLQENPVIETVYPSESNFILLKTTYATELASWLMKHKIAIRDFPPDSLLHQHLRITVGNEEQNQLLISVLSNFSTYVSGLNDAKNFIY